MKKFRIMCLALVCVMAAGILTGCLGQKMAVTIEPDGACSYRLTYVYEKSLLDLSETQSGSEKSILYSGDFEKEEVTINGRDYYAFSRTLSFRSLEEIKTFLSDSNVYFNTLKTGSKDASRYEEDSCHAPFSSVTVDQNTFVGQMSQEIRDAESQNKKKNTDYNVEELNLQGKKSLYDMYKEMGMVIEISIEFPNPVKESNGNVSGNKVTWSLDNLPDDGKLIAVCGDNTMISSDHVPPVISGVKNGGLYNKTVKVSATDDVSLRMLTLNEKHYNMNTFFVSRTGTYVLAATDANNNKTTLTFKIDQKKPSIKGVKNGRTYKRKVTLKFSDRNGIRSAKVNGKKVSKNRVVLKKKGRYTVKVTDKAGNRKTVKFRIK